MLISIMFRILYPILILTISGCSDAIGFNKIIGSEDEIEPISFLPKFSLPQDENGYYHLALGNGYQTLARLDGIVFRGDDTTAVVNVLKVGWWSSLNWNYDEYVIPTINSASYSRSDGSVSTMIAVIEDHRNDTMVVYCAWYDDWRSEEGISDPHFIVID